MTVRRRKRKRIKRRRRHKGKEVMVGLHGPVV
jgi:hypothetical protein